MKGQLKNKCYQNTYAAISGNLLHKIAVKTIPSTNINDVIARMAFRPPRSYVPLP